MPKQHKVCIYGAAGTGRRMLILSGSREYSQPAPDIRDIGVAVWSVAIDRPGGRLVQLDVFRAEPETAALPFYSDGASALVFVFSIASVASYNSMLAQIEAVAAARRQPGPARTQAAPPLVFVVGTHLDAACTSRTVETAVGKRFCSQFNYCYIELAATSGPDVASKLWGVVADAVWQRDFEMEQRAQSSSLVDVGQAQRQGAAGGQACGC
jgi:hypothetical protein